MRTFVQYINEIRLPNPMISHLVRLLVDEHNGRDSSRELNKWLNDNAKLRWERGIDENELMAQVRELTSAITNSLIRQTVERGARRMVQTLKFRVERQKSELMKM